MAHRIASADLSTGVTLEYAERGDPAGTPMLLLHGGFDSWHAWKRVLDGLPPSIRALAPTLRGQGESSKPSTGYRPSEMAADVAAFADTVGVQSVVLVAHSSSSLIAQRFAVEHPERTSGLVLLGAFASMRDNPIARELHEAALELTDPVDEGFVREFQTSGLARPVPTGFIDVLVRETRAPAHVWRALSAGVLHEDALDDLRRIAAPTLIMWGDRDPLSPRSDQETLAAAIRDAHLTVHPGGGHCLHWEEPARVADELVRFVRSLDASPMTAASR
jgi:non-heme chloroperoxidase